MQQIHCHRTFLPPSGLSEDFGRANYLRVQKNSPVFLYLDYFEGFRIDLREGWSWKQHQRTTFVFSIFVIEMQEDCWSNNCTFVFVFVFSIFVYWGAENHQEDRWSKNCTIEHAWLTWDGVHFESSHCFFILPLLSWVHFESSEYFLVSLSYQYLEFQQRREISWNRREGVRSNTTGTVTENKND